MNIQYNEVKRLFRFKQRDNSELNFSDYDIRMATNEAIRYVANALSLQNADFMERQVTIKQEDTTENMKTEGIELPDDFLTLLSVNNADDHLILQVCLAGRVPAENEYKIVGNRLYTGCGHIDIFYKKTLKTIPSTYDTEDIIVPEGEGYVFVLPPDQAAYVSGTTFVSADDAWYAAHKTLYVPGLGEIGIPNMYIDAFVDIVTMVMGREPLVALQGAVNALVDRLVPRRRYRAAKIAMPWKI